MKNYYANIKKSKFENEIIKESSAYHISLTKCSSRKRLYQTQKQFDNIINIRKKINAIPVVIFLKNIFPVKKR